MSRIEKVVVRVVNFFAKALHIEFTQSKIDLVIQFIKFGIIGISNTVISYIIYAACLIMLRVMNILTEVDYLIAQLAMFLLSVLWSFYWNNKVVFIQKNDDKRNLWRALYKVYISYAFTNLFLSTVLLTFWINVLGISEFIAPIINLIITVPLNFIIQKFWAFRKGE